MAVTVLPEQTRREVASALRQAAAESGHEMETPVADGGLELVVTSEEVDDGLRLELRVTVRRPEEFLPDNMLGFPEHLDGLEGPCKRLSNELVTLVYDTLDGQVGYFQYDPDSQFTAPEYVLTTTFPR